MKRTEDKKQHKTPLAIEAPVGKERPFIFERDLEAFERIASEDGYIAHRLKGAEGKTKETT